MPAAEDVERQVAIAVIIAVEEPSFLMPMQRIIGGVEIERDLAGRPGVRIEEQIDEQRLDRTSIGADPGIPAGLGPAMLQPVQGALARQRRTVAAPGLK